MPGAHTPGPEFEKVHAGLLACNTGPKLVADTFVAQSVSVDTLALAAFGCVGFGALSALQASVETVRTVVEARACSVVATHTVLFTRRVVSARAFKLAGDTDESLVARTDRSGARAVSVSAAWVEDTARALTGAVRFGESEVAVTLSSADITKALSGTHYCGSSI